MKGSAAARLGKAPVAMVMELLDSFKVKFENNHNKYPKTISEFSDEQDKWLKLFKKINKKVDSGITVKDFIKNMRTVFSSKTKHIASSKLMQIKFISELLSLKKELLNEIMTDMAFLAQKKGKQFGPFGKLY